MQQIGNPPHSTAIHSKLVSYNTKQIITDAAFNPIILNTKLANNPFLKDQEKFHFFIYKINDYNRRVSNKQITDPYEAMFFERLHSAICDLPYIQTKEDQISRLEEIMIYYKEQEKLINQRKDQGYVRYQVTKEMRDSVPPEKQPVPVSQDAPADELPYKKILKQSLPYKKGWRTAHKELDIPARRLNQYKRKMLNIAPFIEVKEEKKAPRIAYPKPPKIQTKIQEPQEPVDDENKQGEVGVGADGEVIQKEGEQGEEAGKGQKGPEEPEQQDLGGFGQQPGEPEEEEPPNEQDDKLAPKLKSFTLEKQNLIRNKEMKSAYQFYRGDENEPERRMQQKYLKLYQNNIKKQKEEIMMVQIADEWGKAKGKIQKQRQKKLENGKFHSQYCLSAEEPPKMEMLSPQEQIKFGFATMNLRKPKHQEINLSEHHLPKIGQQNLFEKSIRKDRLKSLKTKYQKMLNLQEFEDRETAPSICQYSSRKRGLSEVIRNHSKSKQRLNQLDEVTRIKQKLARGKVGVDIRSLSMGLCLPEQQTEMLMNEETGSILFPDKILPSNPFMVETKKKKKKK